MAVNPKLKARLSELWEQAEEAAPDLRDGEYQFRVESARFAETKTGKPQFVWSLKVVGGSEEARGHTFEKRDNLETAQNMTFFKKTLARLNISSIDLDDILDGTLSEQMAGKTFSGQVVSKGGFQNVYVNRLLSEGIGEGDEDAQADEEKPAARKAPKAEAADEEPEESEEAAAEGGEEDGIPEPAECAKLAAPKVKALLAALGVSAEDVKSPRQALVGISALAHGLNGEFLDLPTIKAVQEALRLNSKPGTPVKQQIADARSAVMGLVEG